ncbi:MAG: hypothetical protein MUF42_15830 [Cytophagaceae bacterium]|jgi:hypothetical protein|nr:hypothetical protein [Cytophagaceae bacterium]
MAPTAPRQQGFTLYPSRKTSHVLRCKFQEGLEFGLFWLTFVDDSGDNSDRVINHFLANSRLRKDVGNEDRA